MLSIGMTPLLANAFLAGNLLHLLVCTCLSHSQAMFRGCVNIRENAQNQQFAKISYLEINLLYCFMWCMI